MSLLKFHNIIISSKTSGNDDQEKRKPTGSQHTKKMFPTHFLLFKNLTGNNCKSERGQIIDGAATTTGYGMTH